MTIAHTRVRRFAAVGALAIVPIASGALAAVDTESYRQLDTFMEVYNTVKANYVDKVDDKTLVKGAIDGMLAALDPHSSYADGLEFDNLKIQTDGNYGGLGLTVTQENGAVKVIAPICFGASPACSSRAILCVITRVLPEPAPASTRQGLCRWWTASSWAGLRVEGASAMAGLRARSGRDCGRRS